MCIAPSEVKERINDYTKLGLSSGSCSGTECAMHILRTIPLYTTSKPHARMPRTQFMDDLHLRLRCYKCDTGLSKDNSWKSHFEFHHHYKITQCENCGKEHWIKMNFSGSGHDEWDGEKSWVQKTIEEKS